MKRVEARIEGKINVQHSQTPTTWEIFVTPSRFHALLIRSQYAQVVPFVLSTRLYCAIIALARAPALCACFEPVQNKREGLALPVAHADPIPLALRDIVSLCIALLYRRACTQWVRHHDGRQMWLQFIFVMVHRQLPEVKNRLKRSQKVLYIHVAQAQCACCTRSESAARATWAHWEHIARSMSAYWNHTENTEGRSVSESWAYCGLLYKATD